MNMDIYWPQQKVFLLGILSLFPEKLTRSPITLGEYWYYFSSKTDDELVQQLCTYKRAGYLEFKEVPLLVIGTEPDIDSESYSEPRGFLITSINAQKATDDLMEYLENWSNDKLSTNTAYKPDDHRYQYKRLFAALKRVYKRHAIPHINIVDMYGDKTHHYNYEPPFWETVLSPHLVIGQYRIRQMDYDLNNGGQPFVDIEIISEELQRHIELQANNSPPISDEEPKELKHRGLRIKRDGSIDYNGTNVQLTGQEVSALRVLMERPEELRLREDISVDLSAKNTKPTNLAKLISSLRRKLKEVIGYNCIENKSGQGWMLTIHPIE